MTATVSRPLLAGVLLLFVGSGCAALIYEVVWFQLLELVIGSTAVSLAVLLGTYMGGMCAGSLWLPRLFAGRLHPLRAYAVLELGIGLIGLAVLRGMPLVGSLYSAHVGHGFGSVLLRGAVGAVCLVPPTLLMGATLPVMARWVDLTPRGVSWLGWCYAGNVAGAAAGGLLAGFYLLRVHDMETATWVAAALNGAVAVLGWALSRGSRAVAVREDETAAEGEGGGRGPVYAAIALSGCSALGAEVVWTRLMALMVGASVYAFSVILAVFLAGMVLGSSAGAAVARNRGAPRSALGLCQLLLVAAIAWAAFLMGRCLPFWPVDPALAPDAWFNLQLDLVRCALVILPAAFLWGASFPLALAAAAGPGRHPEKLVGRVYAANTLGAIVGAVGFSLWVIPAWGTQQAQRLLIVIAGAAAAVALVPRREALRTRTAGVAACAAAVLALAWGVPGIPVSLIAWGRYAALHRDAKALFAGEGMNASVAVTEAPDGARLFHVSGKVEASTVKMDMQLQRMLGHMSALHAAQPRSVLVVGFGAGVTAGVFASYPEVERIVICEIEPLVPAVVSRYFRRENGDVVHDPRVNIVLDDARHFIRTTGERFDVITSDPIHPWVKGAATLYTREYFEMARSRLKPGGAVTQWVPLYESTPAVVRSEIATFLEVFPGGTLWSTGFNRLGHDLVMVGRAADAAPLRVDELQARLDRPDHAAAAESLREVGFASVADLLATYTGREEDLRPWLKGAVINRDANLRLQYLAGMGLNHYESTQIHDSIIAYRRFPEGLFEGSSATRRRIQLAIFRKRAADERLEAAGDGVRAEEPAPLPEGDAEALNNEGCTLAMDGRLQEAVARFKEALRLNPADPEIHANLGNAWLLMGRAEDAIAQYEEALRLKPGDPGIRENLATAKRAKASASARP